MLSALLILFVTSLIVLDVVGRGLFNKPLTGTVEIVSNVIVVIAFLQISYSIQTNGMFHTDMFVNILPESLKKFVRLLGELAGAALLGMMIYASWEPMLHSWSIGEYFGGGQFRFPVYPVRTVVVFCCCLAFINYLMRALDAVTGSNSSVSQEEL